VTHFGMVSSFGRQNISAHLPLADETNFVNGEMGYNTDRIEFMYCVCLSTCTPCAVRTLRRVYRVGLF